MGKPQVSGGQPRPRPRRYPDPQTWVQVTVQVNTQYGWQCECKKSYPRIYPQWVDTLGYRSYYKYNNHTNYHVKYYTIQYILSCCSPGIPSLMNIPGESIMLTSANAPVIPWLQLSAQSFVIVTINCNWTTAGVSSLFSTCWCGHGSVIIVVTNLLAAVVIDSIYLIIVPQDIYIISQGSIRSLHLSLWIINTKL